MDLNDSIPRSPLEVPGKRKRKRKHKPGGKRQKLAAIFAATSKRMEFCNSENSSSDDCKSLVNNNKCIQLNQDDDSLVEIQEPVKIVHQPAVTSNTISPKAVEVPQNPPSPEIEFFETAKWLHIASQSTTTSHYAPKASTSTSAKKLTSLKELKLLYQHDQIEKDPDFKADHNVENKSSNQSNIAPNLLRRTSSSSEAASISDDEQCQVIQHCQDDNPGDEEEIDLNTSLHIIENLHSLSQYYSQSQDQAIDNNSSADAVLLNTTEIPQKPEIAAEYILETIGLTQAFCEDFDISEENFNAIKSQHTHPEEELKESLIANTTNDEEVALLTSNDVTEKCQENEHCSLTNPIRSGSPVEPFIGFTSEDIAKMAIYLRQFDKYEDEPLETESENITNLLDEDEHLFCGLFSERPVPFTNSHTTETQNCSSTSLKHKKQLSLRKNKPKKKSTSQTRSASECYAIPRNDIHFSKPYVVLNRIDISKYSQGVAKSNTFYNLNMDIPLNESPLPADFIGFTENDVAEAKAYLQNFGLFNPDITPCSDNHNYSLHDGNDDIFADIKSQALECQKVLPIKIIKPTAMVLNLSSNLFTKRTVLECNTNAPKLFLNTSSPPQDTKWDTLKPNLPGFATASGRTIKIDFLALQKSTKMFSELSHDMGISNDIECLPILLKKDVASSSRAYSNASTASTSMMKLHLVKNVPSDEKKYSKDSNQDAFSSTTLGNGLPGFATAAGRSIKVDPVALNKSKQLFSELTLDLSISKDNESLSSFVKNNVKYDPSSVLRNTLEVSKLNDATSSPNDSLTNTSTASFCANVLAGFATASGHSIKIDPIALQKSKQLFTELTHDMGVSYDDENVLNPVEKRTPSNKGFSTASGKIVSINPIALDKAKNMFADLNDAVISPGQNHFPEQSASVSNVTMCSTPKPQSTVKKRVFGKPFRNPSRTPGFSPIESNNCQTPQPLRRFGLAKKSTPYTPVRNVAFSTPKPLFDVTGCNIENEFTPRNCISLTQEVKDSTKALLEDDEFFDEEENSEFERNNRPAPVRLIDRLI